MNGSVFLKKLYVIGRKKILLGIDNAIFIRRASPDFFDVPEKIDGMLIISTAFNNEELIAFQFNLLKRYLDDPFLYLVADNSTDASHSDAIRAYCKEKGIAYVRLPASPYSGLDGSLSHGLALNWCYNNLVKKLHPKYFGFIDHDIFPVFHTVLIQIVEELNAYGILQKKVSKNNLWYLWAGFLFFKTAWLKDKAPNFLPVRGLDTNGANAGIFRGLDKMKMISDVKDLKIRSNPDLYVQNINDWIHFTWSYDADVLSKKFDVMRKILNEKLSI